MMKISHMLYTALLLIPSLSQAQDQIKPIILGKTYNSFHAQVDKFGKATKVIAGSEDECNGGDFPDDWHYPSFTIRADGLIKEVLMQGGNGVMFYGKKLDANSTEAAFLQQFKGKYQRDDESKHRYHASNAEDELSSIQFYFKHGKLEKYTLSLDDC